MSSMLNLHAAPFHLVLERFKASLSPQERSQFGTTTLHDLNVAIAQIQKHQASKRRLQGMRRLEIFLEGMKEYDKVIQVFLNLSPILAFVWGPMKFLLQTACTFSEAFDALLDAYQRIGEQLPLLAQYEQLFPSQLQMSRVLSLLYEDILSFHWKAMKHFKQRMWKQLFHAVWRSFDAEFREILRNLREHRALIESQASIIQYTEIMRTQEIARNNFENQMKEESRRRRDVVLQWLSPAKYEIDQETYTRARHPGTCQWIFKNNRFQSWFDPIFSSNQLLWLTGIPGAGKTVLASLVIEEAEKLSGVTVAYFYCKYQEAERNTFLAVARGIIAQLFYQKESLLAYLYDKASQSGQTTMSTDSLAKEILQVTAKYFSKLYVIIDGIDECDREQRKNISTTFQSIWVSLPPNDVDSFRCLFISQDDNVARKDFAPIVSLILSESDLRHDITSYVKEWSWKLKTKFGLSQDSQNHIQDLIIEKAEGMFLFARLMCSHLYNQTSSRKFNDELSVTNFPSGASRLDAVYARITSRVFEESDISRSDSLKLLNWLVCAKRPLKWSEIQCATSIDLDEQSVDWEHGSFRVDSKELCGSLVDIQVDGTVNLVHHTARRYLVDKRLVDENAEDLALALLCIGYLSFPCFDLGVQKDDIDLFISLGYYGFLDYSYAYWSTHVEKMLRVQQSKESLQEVVDALAIFVDMYWIEPQKKTLVPKKLMEYLDPLRGASNFDRITVAVYAAKKQLYVSNKPSNETQVSKLNQIMERIRTEIETIAGSSQNHEKFKLMYGSIVHKCPHANCVRFYNGFSTQNERDEHVLKHDRNFFCSFPACPTAILGCATLKELRKHETNYHGTISIEDQDEDFPELPPEKDSFSCEICAATFTRKHNLNNHIRILHRKGTQERFVCTTCGKSFIRQGDRTRHEKNSHSASSIFICGGILKNGMTWGCGREFNRGDSLNRHWTGEKGKACILPKQQEEESEASV